VKLEDRVRQSIRRRASVVVLRSDVAALGSPTQVTHALDALLRSGELLRLATGIYVKSKREAGGGVVGPQAGFEVIIREVAQKLGLVLHEVLPPYASEVAGEGALVIETETPRVSRTLVIEGIRVHFRSYRRRRRDAKGQQPLAIPTVGVAHFVQKLAQRYAVTYASNPMDQWAESATRLAGDEVTSDSTEDLLIALKRAGKLSKEEVATLAVNYLRERRRHVRSV